MLWHNALLSQQRERPAAMLRVHSLVSGRVVGRRHRPLIIIT